MTRRRSPRAGRERGAATVVAVALVGVVLLVGLALGEVAAWVAAHRRAQAAADLAALAAAAQVAADPCAAATRVATANGARLTSCRPDGLEVRVEVAVDAPRRLGPAAVLEAEARAGPA